jgi:hypothetical protein
MRACKIETDGEGQAAAPGGAGLAGVNSADNRGHRVMRHPLPRRPSSRSACRAQFRLARDAQIVSNLLGVLPVARSSRTASARNSGVGTSTWHVNSHLELDARRRFRVHASGTTSVTATRPGLEPAGRPGRSKNHAHYQYGRRRGAVGIGISAARCTVWSAWFWSGSCPGLEPAATEVRQ